MSSGRRNVLFGLLGVTGLAATLAASQRMSSAADDLKFFNELIEVRQLITSRYVEQPDEAKMREGAIKGMVEALNDPYTVYVPSTDAREFQKDLTGEYAGIGASINMQEGWLTIVSPLEDSPAFRSGLMAEDRIVSIDGVSTENKPVDECVDMLTGDAGSTVNLSIERKGQRLEFAIVRDRIKTRSVKGIHRSADAAGTWDYLIDPARKIAYIRLTQFTPKCAEEIIEALTSIGADKGEIKGLILDVRFNPGGLLSEAERIADFFLKEGVIVSTKGRVYAERVTKAIEPGTLPDFPIVLLINGSSASASEVLAGALVENNRAIAVGARTFGKGSVQSVIELPSGDGSELKITEQGYYLPSGRSITRKDGSQVWGVDPSDGYYIPMTDAQTSAMLEVRRREEVLRYNSEKLGAPAASLPAPPAAPPATAVNASSTATPGAQAAATAPSETTSAPVAPVNWSDLAAVLAHLKDPQLAGAVNALAAKIDSGSWNPTGEQVNQAGKIASAEMLRLTQFQERLLRELARTEKRIDAIDTLATDPNAKPPDLWPNETNLVGGRLEIKDKDGNTIAVLDITGNNLERWLLDADVKKREETVK
jgi:carboxyl-terminal processing protease